MRTRSTTGAVLCLAAVALLAGCAQPGQLGHSGDDPAGPPPDAGAPAAVNPGPGDPAAQGPAAVPGPVAQAGSDARGALERPVDIRTPGPSELLVRTEVLQPGQASGWIRHPGTVVSAVRSGAVTVQRAGRCAPQTLGSQEAFFLGDGEPHELRNDGPDPVVMTRSELLAPGAPEREPAEKTC